MHKEKYPFFHTLRVRYSEIDAQGVVFNAHYLTYFDTTLNEYMLRYLEYNLLEEVKKTGNDFQLVKSTVEYKQPILFDDLIEVHVRPARVGRSSITFELAIYREGEDDLLSLGEVIWVYSSLTDHVSVPLPEKILKQLTAGQ